MRFLFPMVLVSIVLAGSAFAGEEMPTYRNFETPYPIAPFTLTERSGRTVTLDDLRGKVWVASFFFSTCSRACGPMNANLAELHRALADRPDILLVSISVYPEHDTPETLEAYAKALEADPKRWLFLTGDKKQIYDLVRHSFMQTVIDNQPLRDAQLGAVGTIGLLTATPAPGPLLAAAAIFPGRKAPVDPNLAAEHTSYLNVVDREGRFRGILYDGTKPEGVKYVEKQVRSLAGPRLLDVSLPAISFPELNASLNATCAVLLVLGYLAIRARRERLHKVLMLSALTVSVAFLASYLYYHIAVQRHTPFAGQGAIRLVYYVVLLSHVVLAAAVAPLALYTAFTGLRDRRPRHVWIARWTLPIWLYVSVTGVVVYWMLYRLYPPL